MEWIEDDGGNKVRLTEKQSDDLCESVFSGYLQILKSCGVTLPDDVLKQRKDRWSEKWTNDGQ